MTNTDTLPAKLQLSPLDQFLSDMTRAQERLKAIPCACVMHPSHPCASGLPASFYGLAAAYDAALQPSQGPLFFADLGEFQRYASQINAGASQ